MRFSWLACYSRHIRTLTLCSLGLLTGASAVAQTTPVEAPMSSDEMTECLKSTVVGADETMTIGDLKNACQMLKDQAEANTGLLVETPVEPTRLTDTTSEADARPLQTRMTMEALTRSNRFLLTPHQRNFFYPISYTKHPNTTPYEDSGDSLTDLNNIEAELQLSIKILLRENIFDDNGHLYLGYTNHAFWQLYSESDSAPFRETDHQPELILSFTNDYDIWGFRNVANDIRLNHESNGQGGLLSRSWNRLMFSSSFERGNFVFQLSPWYRLPEEEQDYPGDRHGDDNPDITHYMGNFEFTGGYKKNDTIYSMRLRNNLKSDNKGAVELGWSFPLSSNLRGHLQYFNGYGHSLIDYNQSLEVVSFGIVFTDWF